MMVKSPTPLLSSIFGRVAKSLDVVLEASTKQTEAVPKTNPRAPKTHTFPNSIVVLN